MMQRAAPGRRPGLSLLEVLTALAIFLLSVVVISQMVDTAAQTAVRSQRLSRAALWGESVMAEMVAGTQPLQSGGPIPLPDPGWSYFVIVEPEPWSDVPIESQAVSGLNTVHIRVVWSSGRPGEEVEYSLSQLVLDPRLRVPAPEQPPPASDESSASGGSSSTSGGAAAPASSSQGGASAAPGGRP
jgi:hypothetical protein